LFAIGDCYPAPPLSSILRFRPAIHQKFTDL
jgi:hypothetical protein